MQRLSAPPRDHLTDTQVTRLLQAPAITVSGGCELLAPDLTVREDISADLVGGRVERNLFANIHGTCNLLLSRQLVWGVDLVRPYTVLTDGVVTARFNCGVYLLTTPNRVVGETPETVDVAGYDRLVLLNRQVGADYSRPAGQTYRTALADTFAAAGLGNFLIDGAAADNVLPTDRFWPLVGTSTDPDKTDTPVTWLRIINDLLQAINFRSVFCDEDGRFRCQAYVAPSARPSEFLFDADDVSGGIVGHERKVEEDVWQTPNRWVFRQTNRPEGSPAATEGNGVYTVVNQADGPTSINSRGLTWTSVYDFEAASQAKLVELGNRQVEQDRQVVTAFEVRVGTFPPAGHADIYTYRDTVAGQNRRVQLVKHVLDLLGDDTQMRWEAV